MLLYQSHITSLIAQNTGKCLDSKPIGFWFNGLGKGYKQIPNF
ncbi:MAG: hypothetical protein SFU27_01715 [Thermonemataceae bacterium]|nr:hypothetical protein [Thermonemataceae bacterium]